MGAGLLYSRKVMTSNDLRALWLQLAGWTKLYLISAAAGIADAEQVERRLLKLPDDFTAYLKQFYQNADEFRKLLKEHICLCVDMAVCVKEGGCECMDKLRERWLQVAEEIAEWCSRTNPYWRKRDWQPAMQELVSLTEHAIRLCAAKDVKAYIECFDLLDNQVIELADIMSEGIVGHFNIVH